MFSPDADIFFEESDKCPEQPGTYGVLHILRRDIFQCMGINPNTKEAIEYKTLFPGAMAILAGIDLLAKFYMGSKKISVGHRFRFFISTYFKPISDDDPETIYQLRNSLLHSFGLYSKSKIKNKEKEYHFHLGQNLSDFISIELGDVYVVDIQELHRRFEKAVLQFKTDIESNSVLQENFTNMFPKYGAVGIK